jgi:hypothetical protein
MNLSFYIRRVRRNFGRSHCNILNPLDIVRSIRRKFRRRWRSCISGSYCNKRINSHQSNFRLFAYSSSLLENRPNIPSDRNLNRAALRTLSRVEDLPHNMYRYLHSCLELSGSISLNLNTIRRLIRIYLRKYSLCRKVCMPNIRPEDFCPIPDKLMTRRPLNSMTERFCTILKTCKELFVPEQRSPVRSDRKLKCP